MLLIRILNILNLKTPVSYRINYSIPRRFVARFAEDCRGFLERRRVLVTLAADGVDLLHPGVHLEHHPAEAGGAGTERGHLYLLHSVVLVQGNIAKYSMYVYFVIYCDKQMLSLL